MKHPRQYSHLLLVAAPVWALTFFSLSQSPAAAQPAVNLQSDINATGTVSSFDASGLSLTNVLGSTTVYVTNAETEYRDAKGHLLSPDSLTPQTPVTVFYTSAGTSLIATKVVVANALYATGTLQEVTPTGVVITLPGGAAATASFAYTNTTKYEDAKGKVVPLTAFPVGTPIRVTYTKAADTLVASKVQEVSPSKTAKTETTTTTVTREVSR